MYCLKCGAEYQEEAKFCRSCGSKIKSNAKNDMPNSNNLNNRKSINLKPYIQRRLSCNPLLIGLLPFISIFTNGQGSALPGIVFGIRHRSWFMSLNFLIIIFIQGEIFKPWDTGYSGPLLLKLSVYALINYLLAKRHKLLAERLIKKQK